jgi:Domain of unknown function (DUF4214)/FG-GAP-like repeat
MGARRILEPSGRRSVVATLAALGLVAQLAVGVALVDSAQATNALLTEVCASRVPLATPGQPLLTFSAGEVWSSAAVGDVTGDGNPDIVVGGGLSSILWVYSTSCAMIARVDVGGINTALRSGGIQASPALADVNLDGVLDVTIATTSNVVASYSFRNGVATLIRRQDAPLVSNGPNGMIATPAIGYINTDARPDVVTASWGQALDAYSGMGGRIAGWPKWLKDTIWSSPAIGDVDGDGANDVVVGADCEGNANGTQPCGTVGGGFVWAFNRDGSEKWRYFLKGQVVWSSPALADLNGDGAQDVVVGSGGYWGEPAGRVVTALNGRTGGVLWTAGTPARVVGSPSLADVTGDGIPDVFVVTYGGYLMAFNGVNGAQLWAACITDSGSCGNTNIGTKTGVALADIDGDGRIEAVTQGEQKLRVYDAASGALEVAARSSYPGTLNAPANTPTIAQVGGQALIVQPVRGDNELVITVWRTGVSLGAAPWPTFKANSQRTGAAALPAADVARLQAFVRTIYRDFLGRDGSSAEVGSWTSRLEQRQMSRYDMATELSRSDEWISSVITKFYRDTLNRAPDPAGLAGWIKAARSGMPVAQIASAFYASPEYFSTVGRGDYQTWVSDLYVKLLHRSPDAGGLAGWVRALRSGMPRDQLAFGFYQSPETLGVRVNALYLDLLGRPAEPGSSASWVPFVKANGDLVLAAALAASSEYLQKAL